MQPAALAATGRVGAIAGVIVEAEFVAHVNQRHARGGQDQAIQQQISTQCGSTGDRVGVIEVETDQGGGHAIAAMDGPAVAGLEILAPRVAARAATGVEGGDGREIGCVRADRFIGQDGPADVVVTADIGQPGAGRWQDG